MNDRDNDVPESIALSGPSSLLVVIFGFSRHEWRNKNGKKSAIQLQERSESVQTTADLGSNAVAEISGALRELLADVFVLYLKTKNFHWHMSGPHFRDYHLLLDEHAEQIFAMTDDIAERARKIGWNHAKVY